MSTTLAAMDDENPGPKDENAEQVRRNPAAHLETYKFRPGAKPGPGRPRITPEERERRAQLKSLEQHLKDVGVIAAVRLRELVESEDESIAQRAVEFATEKAVELQSKPLLAGRQTIDVQRVEEAQRLLTEGEDSDGEEQG